MRPVLSAIIDEGLTVCLRVEGFRLIKRRRGSGMDTGYGCPALVVHGVVEGGEFS